MDSTRTMLTLGFVFTACGLTFLVVGLTTHLVALWALGPAFMGLGIVFLATPKVRSRSKKHSGGGRSMTGDEA